MVKKQTTSALPHLTHGIAMPQVQVTGDKPMMPGQKSLPSADWKNSENQQMVPGMDTSTRSKKIVIKQGVPCTSRPSRNPLPPNVEPPPVFSSQPSTVAIIRSATESRTQKQMHRMEGGIDPVVLLTTRLESWRLAIKNLVTLFKKIVLVENRTSKGLVNASQEIELPFKNSNGQFLENGGIQDVFSAIRDYTMQHGIMHHESSSYLQGAVIPALRAIKSDIKTMILEIEKDKSLKSIYIYDSRIHVNRLITRLNKTIESTQYSPHTADQNPDPFLLNLSVIHAIRELCDCENRLHDNIMNLQQEVAIFEQKIIENTRHILQGFHDYRIDNKMEHEDFIGTITDTFDNMEPSTEWNTFVQRNQYNLVQENSAYKTENDVDYPSQHSRYVRASKIGPLQLKTGITKSWTEGIYILTPAGFLHGYKTPKHFQSNPLRPTYSVFVPNSTVDIDDDTFELRSGQNKKISMGANRYVFRAPTRAENQSWYEALSALSERFESAPLLESTESNFANTPSHRDLPPLPANVLPIEENNQRRAIEAPAPTPLERDQPSVRDIPDESLQESTNRQEQPSAIEENHSTPKQQYLKAYPAAEQQETNIAQNTQSNAQNTQSNAQNTQSNAQNTQSNAQNTQSNAQNTQSSAKNGSKLGRSNTITGDNQLANITAGGQAATTNYIAGDHSTGNYHGTTETDKDIGKYASGDLSGRHDDHGKYATDILKTNVYDDPSTNYSSGKYAYTSEDREKYSLGGHTPGDHGKYAINDNSDGNAKYSSNTDKYKHAGNHNYGKNFTSGDKSNDKSAYANQKSDYSSGKYNSGDKYDSSGDKYDTTGNKYGDVSDNYGTSDKHTNVSGKDGLFNQRLASNEPLGDQLLNAEKSYDPASGYQSKIADHFDDNDSFTLGRDGFSNSKQGAPGL